MSRTIRNFKGQEVRDSFIRTDNRRRASEKNRKPRYNRQKARGVLRELEVPYEDAPSGDLT